MCFIVQCFTLCLLFTLVYCNNHFHNYTTNFLMEKTLDAMGTRDLHCSTFKRLPQTFPTVYLTVSALADVSWNSQITKRQIVMNWRKPDDGNSTDWIGLFDKQIKIGQKVTVEHALEFVVPQNNQTDGRQISKTVLIDKELELKEMCLGYYIGYVREKTVVKTNCLRTSPFWMEQLQPAIGNMKIHHIMIPGTHDSGAIKKFEGYFAGSIVNRYSVNQEESIWNQLVMGIRSFDLRVLFVEDVHEFYVMHSSLFRFGPLRDVVTDVQRFLNQCKEIVMMDFHRFYPIETDLTKDNRRHNQLKTFLVNNLKDHILDFDPKLNDYVTPNHCWKQNRTLLISYSFNYAAEEKTTFWPSIKHDWDATATKCKGLYVFLKEKVSRLPLSYPVASMAHLSFGANEVLTDAFSDILGRRYGIRSMAHELAPYLDRWFRDKFWKGANIVATDFFMSNNLVEICKVNNLRRYMCKLLNKTQTELSLVSKVLKIKDKSTAELTPLNATNLEVGIKIDKEISKTRRS